MPQLLSGPQQVPDPGLPVGERRGAGGGVLPAGAGRGEQGTSSVHGRTAASSSSLIRDGGLPGVKTFDANTLALALSSSLHPLS